VVPFLEWLEREHPQVLDFPQLSADHLRSYRAWLSKRPKRNGGRLDPTSLLTSHKALRAFLKWIQANNRQLQMDPALLEFQRPRQPYKQAVLFDLGELRRILKVCETPAEEVAVRLLVGAGLREAELCGLRVKGLDGNPNLLADPSEPGRFLLRVSGTPAPRARRAATCPSQPGWRPRSGATRPAAGRPTARNPPCRLGRGVGMRGHWRCWDEPMMLGR